MEGTQGRNRVRTKKKKVRPATNVAGDDEYEYDYTYSAAPPLPPHPAEEDTNTVVSEPDGDVGFRTRGPSMTCPVSPEGPNIRSMAYHQGPEAIDDLMPKAQLVQLPRKIDLGPPAGSPEISKFQKRKKKAKHAKVKIFQDAANSCRIEVDDNGNVQCVMLTDDLANTFLQFGKETYEESDPVDLHENLTVPLIAKKKALVKDTYHTTKNTSQQDYYQILETVTGLGQNKKYKKVKLKKTKLKGKTAKVDLLFAADKADLVVDEYTDQVGKVYVALPDREVHKTYLFALPERMDIITEEFSREIPIRRAVDDKAVWYLQDTSSEESTEDEDFKPVMQEMAMEAVDEPMPGGGIGFDSEGPEGVCTRMVLE